LAAGSDLAALVDELIDAFNRRSLDVPDRLFARQTQLVLNGIPFEARLGRPPTDPLVLLLARGAAGYRFAAKAVQHAVPDAKLQRGELRDPGGDGARTVSGQAWLSGRLRETNDPVEMLIDVAIDVSGLTATRIAVSLADPDLVRLQEARLRP
jgi:hypothetical protein